MPSTTAAAGAAVAHDLAYWRQRILASTLRGAAITGIIAYVPSVTLLALSGQWLMVAVDTFVYAWVLILVFAPGFSYRTRVTSMLLIIGGLGCMLSATLGSVGSGLLWLAMVPVFTAILLGLRAAVVALVALVLAGGIVGAGILTGHVHWFVMPAWSRQREFASWLVNVANAVTLGGATSISIAMLLRGLGETNRALAREIADRARAESERHALEAQLREAQKLEAVGRIAGGVAHDFNNLLVPILGYAELVRLDLPGDSVSQRYLDDVVRSAERARGLVQRLLSFSRQAHLVRTPVRVDAVVRESDGLLRAAVPRDIAIEYELTATRATVLADAGELGQILMNLVANAGYAMRQQGGRLSIALADGPGPFEVTLTVADTGPGMDAATLERAFEPFFTTKPSGEGSGLGLATVKSIVRDLGGHVQIASSPAGTRVDVTLPLAAGEADGAEAAPTAAAPPALAPPPNETTPARHVLVVDDEPEVLRTAEALLARLGFRVTTVGSGADALAYLGAAPHVDLLLTDHAMPAMTGIALAEAVHPHRATLPILLASGFLDDAARQRLAAAGIVHVLNKPYTPAELAAALRDALGEAESADAQA